MHTTNAMKSRQQASAFTAYDKYGKAATYQLTGKEHVVAPHNWVDIAECDVYGVPAAGSAVN